MRARGRPDGGARAADLDQEAIALRRLAAGMPSVEEIGVDAARELERAIVSVTLSASRAGSTIARVMTGRRVRGRAGW